MKDSDDDGELEHHPIQGQGQALRVQRRPQGQAGGRDHMGRTGRGRAGAVTEAQAQGLARRSARSESLQACQCSKSDSDGRCVAAGPGLA